MSKDTITSQPVVNGEEIIDTKNTFCYLDNVKPANGEDIRSRIN